MKNSRWVYCSIAVILPVLLTSMLLRMSAMSSTQPEQPTGWQVVGQIGGPVSAVAVQGDYAYMGVSLRLIVLDVSNPATPTEVGSTTPFPYFVEGVVVSGTLAYVATGGSGLRVVDVSDPANPTEIGAWDSPGYAEGVAVSGGYAYVADGPYGLRVVDVSDPAHPTPIGLAYDMNYAFEVAVSGHYAYIAAAGAGLLVADVSDPAHPVEVRTLDTPGYAYGVAVSGDPSAGSGQALAYMADGWEGLRVVDISNPASPVEMGACDTPGWALNVAVAGSTAYVADGAFGLRVVDVSDPAHPHEIGTYETTGLARRLAIAGDMALVADTRVGLRVVSVMDIAHPTQVGLYSLLADARRVTVVGSYAYVAAGFDGLRIVDISDPTHPKEVGVFDAGGTYASSVVVRDNFAYLATFISNLLPAGLYIVDISDPTNPILVWGPLTHINGGSYRDIALQGQTLYIADEGGLRLIDVSEPTNPTLLSSILLGHSNDLTVSGTLAYVGSGIEGLMIVDVSNSLNPILLGVFDSPAWAQGVAVTGTKAFLSDAGSGLRIVDVSNPGLPVETGFYDTPGSATGVTISSGLAFVSDDGGGIQVVDVSNPFSPTLVQAINTPGDTWYTTLAGNYAYVADGCGGLLILEKVSRTKSQITPMTVPDRNTATAIEIPAQIKPDNISGAPTLVVSSNSTNKQIDITSTCLVTSSADNGPGTLRDCLQNASSGDTITFDPLIFPPANPVTIGLVTRLPTVAQGHLTIDASNAGVILDGSSITEDSRGLVISSDGNIVRGLQVYHFDIGIYIQYGVDNIIGGDRSQGSGAVGQGNVISQNNMGIQIQAPSNNNTVIGNLIGTDLTGTMAKGNNSGIGVYWSSHNRIGGSSDGTRNIISGNVSGGIGLSMEKTVENVIAGNYIGVDISGTRVIGNGDGGVVISEGASGNVVGGRTPEERNIISGQIGGEPGNAGVVIIEPNTTNNSVIGNYIGTDATGTIALGNDIGVRIGTARYNRVGGTTNGERNVISGNSCGIQIQGVGSSDNIILGNYIGTDASGTRALGNGHDGIQLIGDSKRGFIGGATKNEHNIVSGNGLFGIIFSDAGVEYNFILGNYIGTDVSGTVALGNGGYGLWLVNYVAHNFIQDNTIAYNGWANPISAGIFVSKSPFNTIRRNAIYSHPGQGIWLDEEGNNLLPAPLILTVTETTVSGTACPGCTVEVFSDAQDEGRFYEGSTVADASGAFLFDKGSRLSGPFITATATDRYGNTSEFSSPVMWKMWIYFPVLRKGP